jgi:hypothetical protein
MRASGGFCTLATGAARTGNACGTWCWTVNRCGARSSHSLSLIAMLYEPNYVFRCGCFCCSVLHDHVIVDTSSNISCVAASTSGGRVAFATQAVHDRPATVCIVDVASAP